MKVEVARWGNSSAVRLPDEVADQLGLKPGSTLDLVVEGGELRLRPVSQGSRERLAAMFAEMRRLGLENQPELVDWGPDRGSEIIDDEYSRREIKP